MPEILEIPAEVLVYGASVIHHSKRPLLQNYYNFTHIDDERRESVISFGRTRRSRKPLFYL